MVVTIGQVSVQAHEGVVELFFPIGQFRFGCRFSRNTVTGKVHAVVAADGKILLDQYLGGNDDTQAS